MIDKIDKRLWWCCVVIFVCEEGIYIYFFLWVNNNQWRYIYSLQGRIVVWKPRVAENRPKKWRSTFKVVVRVDALILFTVYIWSVDCVYLLYCEKWKNIPFFFFFFVWPREGQQGMMGGGFEFLPAKRSQSFGSAVLEYNSSWALFYHTGIYYNIIHIYII